MEYSLKMFEDHCCGGGHCGPLPGYEFKCPLCEEDSLCRTGFPLEIDQKFKCIKCKGSFKVLEMDAPTFKVESLDSVTT